MRIGAEYREALRDGRKVFVMGEGRVDDVTTHPATQPMVEQYVAWYDRHFDPAWADRLLAPPNVERKPHALGIRGAENQRGRDRDWTDDPDRRYSSAPATSPTPRYTVI